MKKIIFAEIAAAFIFVSAPSEGANVESKSAETRDADRDWKHVESWDIMSSTVDGMTYASAYRKWGGGSFEMDRWWEIFRREFRDRGLVFWMQHPDDSRRFRWLLQTVFNPPYYWKDPWTVVHKYPARRPELAVLDLEEKAAWDKKYISMRAAYIASSVVSAQDKAALKYYELYNRIGANLQTIEGRRSQHLDWAELANEVLDFGNATSESLVNGKLIDALPRHILAVFEDDPDLKRNFVSALKVNSRIEFKLLASASQQIDILRKDPINIQLTTMVGQNLSLVDYRGKIVLVDIWSNTCSSCIEAMPAVQNAYMKYRNQGFEVVGIWLDFGNAPQDKSKAMEILKRQGVSYPNGVLTGDDLERFIEKFAITGVPVTWLFDRKGLLAMTDIRVDVLDKEVRRLLVP